MRAGLTGNLDRLSEGVFDVLVVGGGVHGLFVAYDAASRGLRVALVERGDVGSGLSFNHQRTIHGGLRALETGDLAKVSQQVAERRRWAAIAPHLVEPLPFLIGTYRGAKRSRTLVGAGFALYDLLGRHRNDGLPPSRHLPPARLVARDEVRARFPAVREDGLTGGALWYDYQVRHPDRLNWCVARAALNAGATLVTHVRATAPLLDGDRVVGMRVADELSEQALDVRARVTVIAAGASAPEFRELVRGDLPPFVRAVNVLVDRPALPQALAAPATSGRTFTAVPWGGFTLVGTWQGETVAERGDEPSLEALLGEVLPEVNSAFPHLAVRPADVRVVHQGLTPAVVKGGRVELLPVSRVLSPGRHAAPGAFVIVGVKFTTARQTAEEAVDRICTELGGARIGCQTAVTPLPYAGLPTEAQTRQFRERFRDGPFDADVLAHLEDWYGTEAADVAACAQAADLTRRLGADVPVIEGEILYAVERCGAVRLADAVLRRTRLGATGHPGPAALTRAAELMGDRLGWLDGRRADEIRRTEARFPPRPDRQP